MGLILTAATGAGCKADIGDPCASVDDCEFGLVCVAVEAAGRTVCQLPPTAVADLRAPDAPDASDVPDASDLGSSEGGS